MRDAQHQPPAFDPLVVVWDGLGAGGDGGGVTVGLGLAVLGVGVGLGRAVRLEAVGVGLLAGLVAPGAGRVRLLRRWPGDGLGLGLEDAVGIVAPGLADGGAALACAAAVVA